MNIKDLQNFEELTFSDASTLVRGGHLYPPIPLGLVGVAAAINPFPLVPLVIIPQLATGAERLCPFGARLCYVKYG